MGIEIMTEVKNRSNPTMRGLVVEKKLLKGQIFYRVLWDDKWAEGDAKFYEEDDIEVVARRRSK